MTPKDKARELVLKFYPEVRWKLGQEDCIKRAKNCALIAVDELINQEEKYNNGSFYPSKYWVAVKKEIDKL